MKGLLFSRVMRTDTYFMSRSRAPPPLPPASVFQTAVPLLLNLFCLAVWTVCRDAFDCFCSVCLHWIHLRVFADFSPFCAFTNNRQFPEIVGDTPVLLLPPINLSDCGRCRSEVFVVVIVDKTRSARQRWWRSVPYRHFAVAPNRMK